MESFTQKPAWFDCQYNRNSICQFFYFKLKIEIDEVIIDLMRPKRACVIINYCNEFFHNFRQKHPVRECNQGLQTIISKNYIQPVLKLKEKIKEKNIDNTEFKKFTRTINVLLTILNLFIVFKNLKFLHFTKLRHRKIYFLVA